MARTAPAGEEFFLHDGSRLRDIVELREALVRMSDEEFAKYTGKTNHFARWIEKSLDDPFLAARVRHATSREGVRKQLFIAMHK